jgi:broad specificity phosphatase PhoE
MLKIYIARHGQNEDNANGILNGHRDKPLTHVGRNQAHELADGIKSAGITFDKVYTSPLSRANETASIICNTLMMEEPEIFDLLIERDFGIMTGKPAEDIERLCAPDIIKGEVVTYFLSPEGAETFPDLLERASVALEYIQAMNAEGSILLATHGDFGKMLYAAYYRLSWQEMLTKFHFGNCELLLLAEDADPNTPHVVKIQQYSQ